MPVQNSKYFLIIRL